MALSGVQSAGGLAAPLELGVSSAKPRAAAFSAVVDRLLSDAAGSHQSAETAVRDLALGRTDNLHGVLTQVAQADLTFRLILEIRNRLSEAYQDVMRMQV